MSSKKDKDGFFEFECNSCGETVFGHYKDFHSSWSCVAAEGWVYRGNSTHYCPTCKEVPNDSKW